MSKNILAGRFLNDFFASYIKKEFISLVWNFRNNGEIACRHITEFTVSHAEYEIEKLTIKYYRDISSLDFKSQKKEGIQFIKETLQSAQKRFTTGNSKKTRGSRRAAGAAGQAKKSAPRARKGAGGAQDVTRRGPVERVERFKASVEGKIPEFPRMPKI